MNTLSGHFLYQLGDYLVVIIWLFHKVILNLKKTIHGSSLPFNNATSFPKGISGKGIQFLYDRYSFFPRAKKLHCLQHIQYHAYILCSTLFPRPCYLNFALHTLYVYRIMPCLCSPLAFPPCYFSFPSYILADGKTGIWFPPENTWQRIINWAKSPYLGIRDIPNSLALDRHDNRSAWWTFSLEINPR